MNVQDGRIHMIKDKNAEQALQDRLGAENLVKVEESEMTPKQKKKRIVSLHDVKSVLGMRLGKARNKPCPCGSGKKFKKCCIYRLRTAGIVKDQ